jgi:hypothetical protein
MTDRVRRAFHMALQPTQTYSRTGGVLMRLTAMLAAIVLAAVLCATALAEGLAQGPWTVRDGAYSIQASDRALYYLIDQPYINGQGTIEAVVTPKKSLRTAGWGTAAIVLTMGPSDYWTLGLVEGPAGEHYTELLEDYQGVHQAQSTGPSRVSPIEGTYGFDWQYGHTYRLLITLAGDNLVGDVFENDNPKPVAHLGWQLGAAPALREGWGGLRCELMEGEFTQVKVTAPPSAVSLTGKAYPQGKSGCVGLYFGEDLPGAQTPPALDELTRRLKASGFETARLTSLDLARADALTYPALRYLVADLRRLPQGAAPRILGWMRQGGILVSLTAPAFADTFYRVGDAWQTWDEFSQHGLAEMAGKGREVVPWTEASLGEWGQSLYPGTPPAKLAVKDAATPSGDTAVVINAPGFVTGWWSLGRIFPAPLLNEGETLTCFWAKGDEHTPEMSVELAEDDGSRWIAVVSLETKWRYYALPPQAFAYWQDNPSKGRGGAGDELRPAHAVRLAFGISGSHTPSDLVPDVPTHQISIGPIRAATVTPANLSALAPAARPELEALSPGFKLHEVRGAKTWQATGTGRLWGLPAKMPVVASLSAVGRTEARCAGAILRRAGVDADQRDDAHAANGVGERRAGEAAGLWAGDAEGGRGGDRPACQRAGAVRGRDRAFPIPAGREDRSGRGGSGASVPGGPRGGAGLLSAGLLSWTDHLGRPGAHKRRPCGRCRAQERRDDQLA